MCGASKCIEVCTYRDKWVLHSFFLPHRDKRSNEYYRLSSSQLEQIKERSFSQCSVKIAAHGVHCQKPNMEKSSFYIFYVSSNSYKSWHEFHNTTSLFACCWDSNELGDQTKSGVREIECWSVAWWMNFLLCAWSEIILLQHCFLSVNLVLGDIWYPHI